MSKSRIISRISLKIIDIIQLIKANLQIYKLFNIKYILYINY